MMMYLAKVSAGVKFKEVLMAKQKRDSIVLLGHLLLPTVAAGLQARRTTCHFQA